ncbi:hypothetical protein J3Q64DRAFT_1716729 [Phycomyces blakesleeanus]|uniref:protein-histidine N-methyltransferase n=1 Tax=Phycomyces blakesleeanus TaxID=4837 RepID=A0ABR3BGW7_PHYBL
MAFKFNFTCDDLDLDETDEGQQLESSLGDLSLEEECNKIPCQQYDILSSALPTVIQADMLEIPSVEKLIYKRTLADVKFQMAEQDTLVDQGDNSSSEVVSMLNLSGNSDLIRGVYEGGFKTWECSVDLVQFLSQLPKEQITNKKILELGCGSSLPSLYLLSKNDSNKVDVQDYNEQVIRCITIPNILLNTILTIQDPSTAINDNKEEENEESSESEDDENEGEDEEEEEEDEEEDRIIGDSNTCDAEADIPAEQAPDMLRRLSERTKAFIGDWSGLPDKLNLKNDEDKYDMIVTSETIYAEHALPDLIRVFQKALKKPSGVGYVAAKTVYFGVGGGILPFCDILRNTKDSDGDKFKIEKVFESDSTVKREILKITWDI